MYQSASFDLLQWHHAGSRSGCRGDPLRGFYETDTAISTKRKQLRAVPRPSSELAEVHIVLYPPDQRRRDIDNYNKALFDALTQTGVWEDDSQVKRMLVEWGEVTKKGKVVITIKRFISPAVAAA
ncbi:RusA family crossover junction endodeoxyribonuclease [Klebsiella pneumoniae]|uniref:RusA family crossover junction endodeoxyribonuclease n=1 Tax=Klebsiella pneumoniae TaxID=573 RepID=UPI003B521B18